MASCVFPMVRKFRKLHEPNARRHIIWRGADLPRGVKTGLFCYLCWPLKARRGGGKKAGLCEITSKSKPKAHRIPSGTPPQVRENLLPGTREIRRMITKTLYPGPRIHRGLGLPLLPRAWPSRKWNNAKSHALCVIFLSATRVFESTHPAQCGLQRPEVRVSFMNRGPHFPAPFGLVPRARAWAPRPISPRCLWLIRPWAYAHDYHNILRRGVAVH